MLQQIPIDPASSRGRDHCRWHWRGHSLFLGRQLASRPGRERRRRNERCRHCPRSHADRHSAVDLPVSRDLLPDRLSGLSCVRNAAAELLRRLGARIRQLDQLAVGTRQFRLPAIGPQQFAMADHRAGTVDRHRPSRRRACRPAVVGQYRQVADLHAHGHFLRRRFGDLEIRL